MNDFNQNVVNDLIAINEELNEKIENNEINNETFNKLINEQLLKGLYLQINDNFF